MPSEAEEVGAEAEVGAGAGLRGGASASAPVRVSARCAGCGACLLTCPTHAIRPQGGTLLVLADLCTGCLECVDVCPVDAIDEAEAVPVPYARDAAGTAPDPGAGPDPAETSEGAR